MSTVPRRSWGQVILWGLIGMAGLGRLLAPASAQVLPPDEDEEFPYRPGLVAEYRAGGRTVVRLDPLVAFDWEAGTCDLRLPPGPFQASWRGRLWTREAGTYRLWCFVQGQVRVRLAGKLWLEADLSTPGWAASDGIELPFDFHPLEVEYARTAAAGRLALFWSGPGFAPEPVPPRFLLHERSQSPAQHFDRGRILAEALRCTACHRELGEVSLSAPALDPPSLPIARPWLLAWLSAKVPPADSNPPENIVRRMPHFSVSAEQAEAIASWLLAPRAVPPPTAPRNATSEDRARLERSSVPARSPSAPKARPVQDRQAPSAKAEPRSASQPSPRLGEKKAAGRPVKPPTAAEGAQLIETRGCLACHTWQGRGHSGWFGGGDLDQLAAKRPAGFLVRWLQDPAAINRHHRMPLFTFSPEELAALAQWEAALPRPKGDTSAAGSSSIVSDEALQQGRRWAAHFRCSACHALPEDVPSAPVAPLSERSDWSRSCGGRPATTGRTADQPAYGLTDDDQHALQVYFSTPHAGAGALPSAARGYELLLRNNCLACHLREEAPRGVLTPLAPLAEQLATLAQKQPALAPLVPAMTPPALISVGDKLHAAALAQAILRREPPHRDYLLVAMPRFPLRDEEVRDLVHYFLTCDRIPEAPPAESERSAINSASPSASAPAPADRATPQTNQRVGDALAVDAAALAVAGARLVTTDGLSCTSCHQVGSVIPDKAPLNARGPSLSMLGQRIRRTWFDRWCADPARIVPRMEMPSVKVPVRGVLDERIGTQLAAVWHVLNTPGFEPPQPNPVRVLRRSGLTEAGEPAVVLHDVVKDQQTTYLFPLVIGLPNRHNVLIDLATGAPGAWWLGDVARQRTKGKSWFWEPGAAPYRFDPGRDVAWTLEIGGRKLHPQLAGERIDIDRLEWTESVQWQFSLRYLPNDGSSNHFDVVVRQRWSSPADPAASGMDCQCEVTGLPAGGVMHFRLMVPEQAALCRWDAVSRTFHFPWPGDFSLRLTGPQQPDWDGAGSLRIAAAPDSSRQGATATFRLEYRTRLVPDRFLAVTPPLPVEKVQPLALAPGFTARRLALPGEIMPSGLAWDAQGRLVFCTLKGEVFRAEDLDADGCEETLTLLCDGLPTPYGIYVPAWAESMDGEGPIDVLVKTGLYRLWPAGSGSDSSGAPSGSRGTRLVRLASGWGCTDDYHDWAVGLVPDGEGGYYIALPCQQDERSNLAARHRGQVLHLVPKPSGSGGPKPQAVSYTLQVISAGHRFPMGLALSRQGALFVTDNQGNYNPFNELNHVRPGAHYGFINALEKKQGLVPPPLEPPAIDIPHPWTRSVNGICFLDTPPALRARGQTPVFGPLEGHLIGCEYDTRRLIRLTLEVVGDTYQGAAYPLSIPPGDVQAGLLGPIVCAVSPSGMLYVGEIRDSGWGAGNNIGQLTQVRIDPDALPCGIARVRATQDGFLLEFFRPVDRQRAGDPASYRIESYRRQSTPAYGGPDLDRRQETISAIEVTEDGRQVRVKLPQLREGYVYEFKLRNLSRDGTVFHPDEAHYTLRRVPR